MRRPASNGTRVIEVFVALVLLLGVSAVGGASAPATGSVLVRPRTLVTLRIPIRTFAHDAGSIAWMTGRCAGPNRGPVDRVVLRAVSGGPERVLASKVCGWTENESTRVGHVGLALSGTRALYWWPLDSGNFTYVQLATATAGSKPYEVASLTVAAGGEGEYLTGADIDANTIVYGTVRMELAVPERCIDEPVPCVYVSVPGLVRRVADQHARPIPGVAVPALLDVSDGLIAVAPAQKRWQETDPPVVADMPVPAAVNGPVEIRDVITGARQSTFAPRGRVLELALDSDSTAVLVDTGSSLQVERYAVHSGRLLERVRVPDGAQNIDVDSGTVVYRIGNDIWRLSAHRTSLLTHASAPPIGLSVDGGQIAWAENVGASHSGRIQSVTLS